MRLIASLLLIVGMASAANAATKMNTTKSKMQFKDVRQKMKGFSIVGFYNFSNRDTVKLGQDTYDTKTNTTFGFGAEYKYSLSQHMKNKAPLSLIGGIVFESPREIQAVNIQGTSIQSGAAAPSFSMMLLQANIDYVVSDQVSLFTGLNFPLPFEQDFGEVTLDGTIGFQGGITMALAKSFAADISYRWINIVGNNGLNRIDADGLLLKGRYIF